MQERNMRLDLLRARIASTRYKRPNPIIKRMKRIWNTLSRFNYWFILALLFSSLCWIAFFYVALLIVKAMP